MDRLDRRRCRRGRGGGDERRRSSLSGGRCRCSGERYQVDMRKNERRGRRGERGRRSSRDQTRVMLNRVDNTARQIKRFVASVVGVVQMRHLPKVLRRRKGTVPNRSLGRQVRRPGRGRRGACARGTGAREGQGERPDCQVLGVIVVVGEDERDAKRLRTKLVGLACLCSCRCAGVAGVGSRSGSSAGETRRRSEEGNQGRDGESY